MLRLEKFLKNLFESRLSVLFKDNLNLLIVFPTIIGGTWQVTELSLLSISFVRFFSISQLISDGILILITGILFYFLFQFLMSFYSFYKEEKSLPKNIIGKISLLFFNIFLILGSAAMIFVLKDFIIIKSLTLFAFYMKIFLVVMLTVVFLQTNIHLFRLLYKFFEQYIKRKKYLDFVQNQTFKEVLGVFGYVLKILSLFTIFSILIFSLFEFRQLVLKPNFTINENKLISRIKEKDSIGLNPKLIYYNDKYLILKINSDSAIFPSEQNDQIKLNEGYLILKSDAFFEF